MESYNPLENLLDSVHTINSNNAQEVFRNIAENLFKNYVIKKGSDIFKFLEIEFYYYSESHKDIKRTKERDVPFVYKRNVSKAGVFFLHDSGVDICFKTEETSYGGILIRSLLLNNDYVVTGPWDCRDALFNYTGADVFPKIVPSDAHDDEDVAGAAKRYNADKAILDENAHYCFYNKRYSDELNGCWININKVPLKRYDATLKTEKKSKYSAKPWNRKQ